LTLQGGADQMLAGPLQAWTSPDAANWTAHPGPSDIAVPVVGCDACGVAVPLFGSGSGGLLVVNVSGATAPGASRVAFSRDGIAWENLPRDAFPAGFEFRDVAGVGAGFIAIGEENITVGTQETVHAVALSSSDGHLWVTRDLPTAGLDPQAGSTANRIVVGPGGRIVTGFDGRTPGTELWWSSAAGDTWSLVAGYPPLGLNSNTEAGSRVNGSLLGSSERMLAYRGGNYAAAWTSSDGRSWETVTTSGSDPVTADVLLPIGVLGRAADGSSWWYGTPLP
jgi:hypothetical protein